MSVNTLVLNAPGRFDLLPEEELQTPGHPADIELRIPATIQGPKRTEVAKGRIWVTDQRVVFAADTLSSSAGASSSSASAPPSYDAPPVLQSLIIPYTVLLSSSFNLPTFSPNNIVIAFLPDPSDSDLPSPGRGAHLEVKVVVGEGAGHGVWKRIEGLRSISASRREEGEVLPAYEG